MGILNVDTIKPVGGGTTITLSTSEINVGAGITFESNGQAIYAGIITATSFSGSGANLTNIPDSAISALTASKLTGALPAISGANLTSLPAQATIANNADNRIITGGSGVNLNAESGLVYNGYNLTISGTGQQQINVGSTNAGGAAIILDGDSNGDAAGGDYSFIRHNTDKQHSGGAP